METWDFATNNPGFIPIISTDPIIMELRLITLDIHLTITFTVHMVHQGTRLTVTGTRLRAGPHQVLATVLE